jgi:hypothetical protein
MTTTQFALPGTFATACSECGEVSHERQYARLGDRHTCERCLLKERKRLGGLDGDPYETFVEALAEAMDLRERETGLHSKRVATHTLLLAGRHYHHCSGLIPPDTPIGGRHLGSGEHDKAIQTTNL